MSCPTRLSSSDKQVSLRAPMSVYSLESSCVIKVFPVEWFCCFKAFTTFFFVDKAARCWCRLCHVHMLSWTGLSENKVQSALRNPED